MCTLAVQANTEHGVYSWTERMQKPADAKLKELVLSCCRLLLGQAVMLQGGSPNDPKWAASADLAQVQSWVYVPLHLRTI